MTGIEPIGIAKEVLALVDRYINGNFLTRKVAFARESIYNPLHDIMHLSNTVVRWVPQRAAYGMCTKHKYEKMFP